MSTSAPAPTHRLHEIGRPECGEEGCEPQMFEGYTQAPYVERRTPTVIGLSTVQVKTYGWLPR